jgi:hypothetical protein
LLPKSKKLLVGQLVNGEINSIHVELFNITFNFSAFHPKNYGGRQIGIIGEKLINYEDNDEK